MDSVKQGDCFDVHNDLFYLNYLQSELEEDNSDLLKRVFQYCGQELCDDILELTKKAIEYEDKSIIYSESVKRNRSKGGVFFFLLRQRLNKNDIKIIWNQQEKFQRETKRKKKLLVSKSTKPPIKASRKKMMKKAFKSLIKEKSNKTSYSALEDGELC